jgi:hypothetical protein
MRKTCKNAVQVFLGVALIVQLTGCVYYSGERRYHPYWYHPAVVVVRP